MIRGVRAFAAEPPADKQVIVITFAQNKRRFNFARARIATHLSWHLVTARNAVPLLRLRGAGQVFIEFEYFQTVPEGAKAHPGLPLLIKNNGRINSVPVVAIGC